MEEDFLISAEEIDNVSEEEMQDLELLVEQYQEILEKHNEDLEDILFEINNSNVYEKLGVQINVTTDYYYSIDKLNDEN